MKRLPAISRCDGLRELDAHLAHAKASVLLDDARRCEALALDLLLSASSSTIAHDELLRRITGYAPTARDDRAWSVGDVLHDLGALAERLCARAIAHACAGDTEAMLAVRSFSNEPHTLRSAFATQTGRSLSTVQRLGRAGLVTRRVLDTHGNERVAIAPILAKHFDAAPPPRSRRMSPRERERIVRAGLRSRRWARLSLHAAATRIAEVVAKHGAPRSVEAIRTLLQSDPRTSAVFPPIRARAAGRRRDALVELLARGCEPQALAARLRRATPLVRRDAALARAAMLRDWAGDAPRVADAQLDDLALARALRPADRVDASTLPDSLDTLRTQTPLPGARERTLAIALRLLRERAARDARTLDRLHPSPREIDACETMLRWAWMLERALAASQFRRVLETLEARAGERWETLSTSWPAKRLREAIRAAVHALHEGVRVYDPTAGGRLAAACSLRIDRALARTLSRTPSATSEPAPRAGRAQPLASPLPDAWGWLSQQMRSDARSDIPRCARVRPWMREPWATHARLSPQDHALLDARFLCLERGERPRTLAELAASMGLDDIRAAHAQQRALAACFACWRAALTRPQ